MLGLVAMPVGLVAGGLFCGLSVLTCLHQNLPIFLLALLLLGGLWKFPEKMVKGFCLLAEGIRWLVTIGLVLAAVESMTGWNPLPGMAPLEEAMATVSSIGIVLLGSLPTAELVRRLLVTRTRLVPGRLHSEAVKFVSAKGQFAALAALEPLLTQEEQDVVRRGKNASKATVAKHATAQEYRASTGLEALFGWLYLQNRMQRIEELFDAVLAARRAQEG